MALRELIRPTGKFSIRPNYFIPEKARAKYFIQHQFEQAIHPPITMHINTPILRQQIPHQDQPFIDHGDEGVRAFAPGVAVGDFFEDVGLLGEGVVADFNVHGKIRTHVKGRVDVDQLEAALLLDFLAQGPFFRLERISLLSPQMSLLVQPLSLPAAGVEQSS